MASQYLTHLFLLLVLHVVNFGEANSAQQPLAIEEEPLEYKLTKFLDIHVGKESNNFQSSLRDSIRTEIRNILEGFRNEILGNTQDLHINSRPGYTNDNSFQLIPKVLKELRTEISEIKNNFSRTYGASSRTYGDEVKNFVNRFPVGVSFTSDQPFPNSMLINSTYVPKNCKEIQSLGYNVSGIYKIQPVTTEKPFMVLCDMETRDGGWTHIMKRFDGSQDFYLNWREYKFGFGDLGREFWLGLENIRSLTSSEKNELLVEVVDRDDKKGFAYYNAFEIGPESTGYPLAVLGNFSGDANEGLKYHVGSKFTTKDFDQDESSKNCAEFFRGAWWYKDCHDSSLNGQFINIDLPTKHKYHGMFWSFKRPYYAYSKARMLVRPAQ